MPAIATRYLGLDLSSPLVASSSPLTRKLDSLRRLADAGVGAVVLHSLFEEQIAHESLELNHFLSRATNMHPEALDYFPDLGNYNLEPDQYLEHLEAARKALSIPVVASLNGCTPGGWTEWASRLESAGASALELNVYSLSCSPSRTAIDLEETTLELVSEVCGRVSIPVAIKLSPYYTSLPNFVEHLVGAGASAVVLFNRFLQPDLDPENLAVQPTATLSSSDDLRLPLRWTAVLHGRVETEIALSGGVHTGRDLLKALLAGAQVGMSASALLARGPEHARAMLDELVAWMAEHEYESVDQLRGSMSQRKVVDPRAFERAQYMKALTSLDDRFV